MVCIGCVFVENLWKLGFYIYFWLVLYMERNEGVEKNIKNG